MNLGEAISIYISAATFAAATRFTQRRRIGVVGKASDRC